MFIPVRNSVMKIHSKLFFFFPLLIGMPSASLLVNLLSALFIPFVFGETEIRFAGQTKFVVNETSTTVIRLVIERIGEPANVTAIVSVRNDVVLFLLK